MDKSVLGKIVYGIVLAGLFMILACKDAAAVPSFRRQTGQDCYSCHTVFPELTPIGRAFKLTGYVLNNKEAKYQTIPPLAGMTQLSFSHSRSPQPADVLPPDIWSLHPLSSGNDVVDSPQQLSVFYAGQIYDKLGAFIQATYSNDANKMVMDNVDIRYANSFSLFDKDIIYGVTLNNSPTVEDIWNSTPAFSFPYASSNVAPTPAAATLIDNGLATSVGGGGFYAYWNNTVYAAVSVYRTSENGFTIPFGAGNHPLGVQVDGAIPYWRVALTHQYGPHSFEIGTYGLVGDTFFGTTRDGPTDHFTDVAMDSQYQYLRDRHSFSAQTTWIHEDQDLSSGNLATSDNANLTKSLDTFRMNGNYYYRTQDHGTLGGSVGFFWTSGTSNAGLYAPAPVSGSRTGSPNSNGFTLEADYLPPWKYVYSKLSLQYIIYNEFNGARTNYDGFGRDATGNNTLYLALWLAF